MAESRRVVYGRINRRSIQEPLYNVRPVREELRALAESKRTAAEVDGVPWYAGDFSFDPAGDFVTGILGFSERERFQEFDEAAWSWLKRGPRAGRSISSDKGPICHRPQRVHAVGRLRPHIQD